MNLVVDGVGKAFGGVAALDDASLEVAPGEVVGLVGPNGAGKTTLVNVVTGVFAPDSGSVTVRGADVTGHRIEQVARRGVSRTYQHIRLFEDATVLENVLVGAHQHYEAERSWNRGRRRELDQTQRRRAHEECERLGLGAHTDLRVSELSYGQRRRVEIARSLMSDPVLLLLDEPVAGMAPDEADGVGDLVRDLGGGEMSVLLIEHNVALVSRVCDRLAVLDWGRVIRTGTAAEVWADPQVRAAYLGPEKKDAS